MASRLLAYANHRAASFRGEQFMRLTLRTLIAFRDHVLPAKDHDLLAERIENAEFAQQILHRMEHLGLADSPQRHAVLSLDANIPANYLESSMGESAVQQFEQVALTNDELLTEVAECHALLSGYDERIVEEAEPSFLSRLYQVKRDLVPSPVELQLAGALSAIDAQADLSEFAVDARTDDEDHWLTVRGLFGPLTSAIVNATVMIVLSLLTVGAGRTTRPIELSMLEGKPETEVVVDLSQELDLEIETDNFAAVIEEEIDIPNEAPALDDHFYEEMNFSTLTAGTASELAKLMAASGTQTGETRSGGKNSVRYYGQEYAARDVVYIVDASGSMRGPRFARACDELLYSLNHLKPSQRFAVLFFSGSDVRAFPNSSKLHEATQKNLRKARRFVSTTVPSSGTEPANSLVNALRREPDIVFFLSDGEIPEQTIFDAQNANTNYVRINTIGFENQFTEILLRELAEQNNGEYRFVP